jgi:type II secretory pathway component PulJ
VSRVLAVGALCLVAFLYYRPLRAYVDARQSVRERTAQVQALQAQKRTLERRLARAGSRDALIRQARQLSLVKPGERLYIVKGIAAWRHDRAAARKAAAR